MQKSAIHLDRWCLHAVAGTLEERALRDIAIFY